MPCALKMQTPHCSSNLALAAVFNATRRLRAGLCMRPSSQCKEDALYHKASLAQITRILGVQAWQAKKRQGATSSLITSSASGMLMCLLSS